MVTQAVDPTTHAPIVGTFVSEMVTPGTGDLAGFQIHRWFFAFNNSSPIAVAGANGMQSAKVTLQTDQTYKYLTGQFAPPNNGAANPDIDLYGTQADDTAYRTGTSIATDAIGTGVFVHDPDFDVWSVQGLFVDGAAQATSKPNSSTTNNPTQFFANAKNIRVEGFVQTPVGGVGADPAAKTQNAGQMGAGALFAMQIVPNGALAVASGDVAGDKGPIVHFDVPEPASMGVIGLAGALLLGRRRRQA
jgi:hypothetical protein